MTDRHESGAEDTGGFTETLIGRLAGRTRASDRYRLRGEFARGGMGAILNVWDEDLRRELAMKVLLSQAHEADEKRQVDERLLARFLEEAQVTGQLDHPGIVPVHELGLDAGGQVYFTMKLVKGKTLAEVFDELLVEGSEWTQTRVVGLVLRVCEAMSYAHSKDVIHRDLKPANVMVGKFGEVYVMDWGLAKILGKEGSERDIRIQAMPDGDGIRSDRRDQTDEATSSPLCTMDGDIVGTPAYMPPEQAAGRLWEMGPHSDVYAVGAMLYHLLAGQMPYVPYGANANPRAVLMRVQNGPPKPLHELAPDAPMELSSIAEKAMAREHSERYGDMQELAADLSAYLEGRVVKAYETGAWAEARKWARRNRALASSMAAGLVLLVAGLVIAALLVERESEVLRLSALQDVENLIAEADELWPPYESRIADYEGWIEEASVLVGQLPEHRAQQAKLRELGHAAGDVWQFPERHKEESWWYEQLTKLIDQLEALQDPDTGLLASDAASPRHGWSVPKRLAFAEELREGFLEGGEYAQRWSEALPAIRDAYPELELKPQMGLVPIGQNPTTKLWEFAHLASGTVADLERGQLTASAGIVLVLIPGGDAVLGVDPFGPEVDLTRRFEGFQPTLCTPTDQESPRHGTNLAPYFISKYEVTQSQWEHLTGSNPSIYQYLQLEIEDDTSLNPVENVEYEIARGMLTHFDLTFPTEAQWEHAARAGTTTLWACGDHPSCLEEYANIGDQAYDGSRADPVLWNDLWTVHAPVGTFLPNGFGLYDVTGNVGEFCADEYLSYDESDPRASDGLREARGSSPRTVSDSFVYRGGSFDGHVGHARVTLRYVCQRSLSSDNVGLRPARPMTQ